MYANSWLYHYYSVQSKIQFGLPYEGPARVQSTTPYLHHHHSHHSNQHHSPTTLQTSLSHPYVASHHVSSYGYHSPVPQHQGSPGLVNHYGSNTPQLNYHSSGEHYRPYAYHIEPQPVDYSSQVNPLSNQIVVPRCNSLNPINGDTNSSINSNSNISNSNHIASEINSPPNKRRALARLEPLYISDHQQESSSDASLGEPNYHSNSIGEGGTVLLTTVTPVRHTQTIHLKAMSIEPPDFMDQWNPSPPWSETTQKVPDIVQQELSPYLARTPPTPTSAPLPSNTSNGPAFSFDWMPEQFVPIMDCSHVNAIPIAPCISHDTSPSQMCMMPIQIPLQIANWQAPIPSDHKIYNLQSIARQSEEDTTNDTREERRSY